jgi:hypothetical protein
LKSRYLRNPEAIDCANVIYRIFLRHCYQYE